MGGRIMSEEEYRRRLKGQNISPQEDAVLRQFHGLPYDGALIPQDKVALLSMLFSAEGVLFWEENSKLPPLT